MKNIKRKIIIFLGWFTIIFLSPCILPIQIIVGTILYCCSSINPSSIPFWCLLGYPIAIIWGMTYGESKWMDEFFIFSPVERTIDENQGKIIKLNLNEQQLNKILTKLKEVSK